MTCYLALNSVYCHFQGGVKKSPYIGTVRQLRYKFIVVWKVRDATPDLHLTPELTISCTFVMGK